MVAEIATYSRDGLVFKYNKELSLLDIFREGNSLPSFTVFNKKFDSVEDFVDYCRTWVN